MSRYVLFLGGPLATTPRLMGQIAGLPAIAADSGIRHCRQTGVTPELWVGDFDSASVKDMADFANVPQDRHPTEKDMSDGDIAIHAALKRGARSLLVAGAFGSDRFDHAFQVAAAGLSLHEAGIDTVLTDGRQWGHPLRIGGNDLSSLPAGTLFSILAFTDLEGLTIAGARWNLKDASLPFGSSQTLSNVVEDTLTVTLGKGRAMVVATPDTLLPENEASISAAVEEMIEDAMAKGEDA